MSVISISRDTQNNLSFVRMLVTDSLATVATADYIKDQMDNIRDLNQGFWQWYTSDIIACAASDGNALFTFTDTTFSSLQQYGNSGGGGTAASKDASADDLPIVASVSTPTFPGGMVVFDDNNGTIKDANVDSNAMIVTSDDHVITSLFAGSGVAFDYVNGFLTVGVDQDIPFNTGHGFVDTSTLAFYLRFLNSATPDNYIEIANADSGSAPSVSAQGNTDTNIPLFLSGKGTAGVQIKGATDGAPVNFDCIGALQSQTIPIDTPTALTTDTPTTLAQIAVQPGVWQVYANAGTVPDVTTTTSMLSVGVSTQDAVFDPLSTSAPRALIDGLSVAAGESIILSSGCGVINVSVETIIYFVVEATFAVSTLGAYGYMQVQRIA